MRTTLVLTTLLVFGCDEGGNNNNNNTHDLAMVVRDLSGTNTDCDLLAQDCGAGRKCIPTWDGQSFIGGCVTDGTVDSGQACETMDSQDSLLDNCKAGYLCDDLFGAGAKICRKICGTDSECTGNDKCGDLTFSFSGFGWCMPSCTPFSTAAGNCPANQDCGETAFNGEQTDPNTTAGFFICKKTGTAAAFESCMGDADCGAGLWCGAIDNAGNAACLPNCDDTHECGTPPGDSGVSSVMCNALTGTPNNAGYCQ